MEREKTDREAQAYEKELMVQAKTNPNAFGILYESYLPRIFGYVYHHVGNREDAEDLTARVFENALRALPRFKVDEKIPVSAWFFRIAHNLTANWYRDQARHPSVSTEDTPWLESDSDETDPEKAAIANEEQRSLQRKLREAINKLPSPQKDVLVLKYTTDLTNAEIGQVLPGLFGPRSEGAIKTLLYRAHTNLRTILEKENEAFTP